MRVEANKPISSHPLTSRIVDLFNENKRRVVFFFPSFYNVHSKHKKPKIHNQSKLVCDMSHWNVVTACTNLVAIWPIRNLIRKQDELTASLLIFAAWASFVSHLLESHKHGSIGFGFPKPWSLRLNYLDRLGCALLIPRVTYIALTQMRNKNLCLFLGCASLCFVANKISEADHSPLTQTRYLLFHNFWHAGIFATLGMFL